MQNDAASEEQIVVSTRKGSHGGQGVVEAFLQQCRQGVVEGRSRRQLSIEGQGRVIREVPVIVLMFHWNWKSNLDEHFPPGSGDFLKFSLPAWLRVQVKRKIMSCTQGLQLEVHPKRVIEREM